MPDKKTPSKTLNKSILESNGFFLYIWDVKKKFRTIVKRRNPGTANIKALLASLSSPHERLLNKGIIGGMLINWIPEKIAWIKIPKKESTRA